MKTKKEELQAELTRLNALRKQVKEKLKSLPLLDVGNWYWVHSSKWDDALIFYNGNEDSFGFSHSGEWTDYYNIGCSKTSPANQEDVNRIFIKEAINRGLVNGVKINSLIDGDSAELKGDRYFFNPYPLYFNLGSRHIFANGKWATIIEQEEEWVKEKEAHRKGAVIQWGRRIDGVWIWKDCYDKDSPKWCDFNKYRIKPEENPGFEVGTKFVLNRTSNKTIFTITEIEDDLVYIGWDGIDNRTYYDYTQVLSKLKNKIWIKHGEPEEKPTLKDNDIAIIERLHDTLLDNHGYDLNSKLLSDSRKLCKRIQCIIEKGAN